MEGKMGGIRPMGMFGSRGSPPPHIGQGAHPGLSPFTPTSEMLHFDLGLKVRRERQGRATGTVIFLMFRPEEPG